MRWLVSVGASVVLAGCSSAEGALEDPCDGGVCSPTDASSDVGSGDAATESSTPDTRPADAAAVDTAIADTRPTDTAVADTKPSLDRSQCALDPDKVGATTRQMPTKPQKYVAYVPATYDKNKASPIVLALHGAGDVATNYLAAVWKTNADARGFVVIAPDGSCAAGPGNTWCSDDGNPILAALDDFEKCYSVDPKRRIVDGFSAGGIMAYAIGLQAATSFAGISITAANLGSAEALSGKKLLPAPWKIPVSHHHGTMDMNFTIASARTGRDQLLAAGHTVFWHEFDGGHTTNAAFALVRWDDLATSRAP